MTGYVLYYADAAARPSASGRILLPRSQTSYVFEPHRHGLTRTTGLQFRLASTDGTRESDTASISTAATQS